MRRLQQKLRQTVQAVAFAPDGRTLASAGNDKFIYLWEQATGKELARLSGHTKAVLCLAFSPDGRLLVSGSADRTVKVWDVPTGKVRYTLRSSFSKPPVGLAFTPDGRTLAAASGSRLMTGRGGGTQWWEVGASRFTNRRRDGCCQQLEYCRDGRTLVLAGEGVVLWDTSAGRQMAAFAQKTCRAVALSPDGKTVAAAEGNGINLWDVESGTKRAALEGHQGMVWSVAFSPDGALLLSGSKDKTARFWNPTTGQEIAAFDWEVGSIQQVAFAPDGMTAAAAGHTGTVVLCDVDANELLARPTMPTSASAKVEDGVVLVRTYTRALAFSPDGQTLATVPFQRGAVALRKRNGRPRSTIPAAEARRPFWAAGACLAFTRDGRTLAVSSNSWRAGGSLPVLLVDVRTGEVRAQFAFGVPERQCRDVGVAGFAFTPGGDHLIVGRGNFSEQSKKTGLHPRHMQQGPFRVTLLEHHGSGLSAVALSPDGTTVACATGKGRIVLWDVAAETNRRCPLGAQGACTSLVYAPDNRTLAGALGEKVLLLDTQSGTVRKLTGHEAKVAAVAFSPDGTRLLSAAGDEVRLWDVATATQQARYEWPFGGRVLCVAFAPDGKGAAAGGRGGLVLWEIEPGA
jgi:WD40 repeat protein